MIVKGKVRIVGGAVIAASMALAIYPGIVDRCNLSQCRYELIEVLYNQ